MAIGFYIKQKAIVDSHFVAMASDFVFKFALPCLLFFSVLKSTINVGEHINLLMAGFMTTFVLFFVAQLYAIFFIDDNKDKGVFVQGVFRSNMAIISLATVANAYGDKGVSVGAIYMGVITILYNILAVITLSYAQNQTNSFHQKLTHLTKQIIKNPLIIALISAFIYKAAALPPPPEFIHKTGTLLANTALPLALLCAGATLDVKSMLQPSGLSMKASLGRIVLAPMVAVAVGVGLQLTPMQLGVLFMMVASPAAAASYVMAKAMGGNEVLAANILAFTTVFGMIGMAVGMAILRILAWV